MFGFFKLSGAPPKAYSYYRASKDNDEKAIIEDLYKAYDNFIKEEEAETNRIHKLLKVANGSSSYDDPNYRELMILSSAFDDLYKYGTNEGYPEFYISLFHQR